MSCRSVLIVGGGFGGVKAALELAKANRADLQIRLVDPKSYFEYHAAFYRLVTGRSPMESCIPYADIFAGSSVEVVRDRIGQITLGGKSAAGTSGSTYRYDTLILALGGEPTYYGIPGVEQLSYGLKSAEEALRLKRHVREATGAAKTLKLSDQLPLLKIVVVGAGASGVELSAELAWYARSLACEACIKESVVTIDLVEAADRVLAGMSQTVSRNVELRLRALGVNVLLNRSVEREELEDLILKDMQIKTTTVVWTAGMQGNRLLKTIEGLNLDRKGRSVVDAALHPAGQPDIFVLGDSAATPLSGMAQTALQDGAFAAEVILAKMAGLPEPQYHPTPPSYAVPVGPKWAAVVIGSRMHFGFVGWFYRRLFDFKIFWSILPFTKAFACLRAGTQLIDKTEK